MRRIFALSAIAVAVVGATALPASAATITVSPTSVTPGATVTVSGDVLANGTRACAAGNDVTLVSNAFAGLGEFAGQGAVTAPVDTTGHFSKSVTLTSSVPAGTYPISGRCGGANLGVQATLTVGGQPRTGASFGPFTVAQVLAICLALCAFGAVLTGTGRRRRPTPRAAGAARSTR
jgi:hypothetical protein